MYDKACDCYWLFYFVLCGRDLALHSVREAVKLAQETNDMTCLQHALVSPSLSTSIRELLCDLYVE